MQRILVLSPCMTEQGLSSPLYTKTQPEQPRGAAEEQCARLFEFQNQCRIMQQHC